MHPNDRDDSTQPVVKKATVKDIVDAVLYLAQAGHVNGIAYFAYVDFA